MRRIVTAREQFEMCSPWSPQAHLAARLRLPEVQSKGLDALGITQRKLNGNFMSWMDELSDRDKDEGGLWYPTGNDWGHHASDQTNVHPDKVFGVMSKTSPQRAWYDNLADTHNIASNHRDNPEGILKPGGISGTDNLKQSLRVMSASDDPDDIHAAFLGTKNVKRRGQTVAIPRSPGDLPKTYDFYSTLRDPETGGAGNYLAQPGVVDSWMSRTMLWSKKRWDDAKQGGKPLTWPGKGSGEGLDKPLPTKKQNPETGNYEVVGMRAPNARDVAARVTGIAGGYDRMRNAMRNGAATHDLPFTHGAQAAVWKSISGNKNPSGVPNHDVDIDSIDHPGDRWDEMWNRRASGLLTPASHGFQVAHRTAAHGSHNDIHGPEDTLDEEWGTPEDIQAILRHMQSRPPGFDHWEDRPALWPLGPAPRLGAFEGPHDNPWSGEQAEGLREHCQYCGADAHEPCDPRCPTHHSDDPAHWAQEKALMGGGHYSPPDNLHLRLNGVQRALDFVDGVLRDSDG